MKTFEDLVKNQFEYGGKKYALSGSSTRESTDDLFDDFGKGWLLGTMGKYIKRYANLKRGRDPLKIATYSYLLWLKRGFHIDKKREIPLDTNLEVKQEYFDEFIFRFVEFEKVYDKTEKKIEREFKTQTYLDLVYDALKDLTNREWKKITEYNMFVIFYIMKKLWTTNHINDKEYDTDTGKENEKVERN